MREVTGKYNTAVVFTDKVDSKALEQIELLCSQKFVQGSKIRIMPDVHGGAGCTIGTTMTIADKVVPNHVGVDIGCGMEVTVLADRQIDLPRLDALIYKKIPSGFHVRRSAHPFYQQLNLEKLRCRKQVNLERAALSIGTLGGGNHFIEVNRGSDGTLYLVIHSGSRHLGQEVACYYQELAFRLLSTKGKAALEAYIEECKASGRERELQKTLKQKKKELLTEVPKALAYLSGRYFDDYIHDMQIIQQFAAVNRQAMAEVIVSGLGLTVQERFMTIHNYIDTDSMILRKGAVSAQDGEVLLIPMNMYDGSLLCRGKGNPEWNFSAPHGAGRLLSRTAARQAFKLEQYQEMMKDIFTTSVNAGTLDECPFAYKPVEEIIGNVGDTAEIIDRLQAIYNFKAPG